MQALIEGATVTDIYTENRDEMIKSLRDDNARLQRECSQSHEAIAELRRQLQPLYQALRCVFGQIESVNAQEGSSVAQPHTKAVWESWKQRLGGTQAKFIDALLLHGGLTQTQLRIHAGCATGSVAGVVCQLNKAGLITKRDGKIFLKEL